MSTPRVRICRERRFSAAVRYASDKLSAEDNRELYGRLAGFKGVGREFRLEVAWEGPVDPLTGMIVNLVEIDRWLAAVTSQLEHRFLNELTEIFHGDVPTTERLVRYCHDELARLVAAESAVRLRSVRLHEDGALSVAVSGHSI